MQEIRFRLQPRRTQKYVKKNRTTVLVHYHRYRDTYLSTIIDGSAPHISFSFSLETIFSLSQMIMGHEPEPSKQFSVWNIILLSLMKDSACVWIPILLYRFIHWPMYNKILVVCGSNALFFFNVLFL